ncbi:MAG: pyridoxal 5'-phosphate synthase glutaminase subunit PdxT [Chloroflexi bacterium]|nr:pyridoxal 5'-phosphate synthase glutaminase subunit PdxT [Chloroflexota bacterium]
MGVAMIGVLALQGDFAEHEAALRRLGVNVREVRLPRDLEGLAGLIIPGGESTTFTLLIDRFGLREPLKAYAATGAAIWGTCAGLIVLAAKVEGRKEPIIGGLNVEVQRNAYGRQADSFEADIATPALGVKPYHAIFIRAPRIAATGKGVEVLARLADGTAVAVRQGNLLGSSFHPELTSDDRFHGYFLNMAKERSKTTRVAAR